MAAAVETKQVPLDTFGKIERALKWGWTVRCRLLEPRFPVGGIEVAVSDVRRPPDPLGWEEWEPTDFEVLTIQGWRGSATVWGIKPVKAVKEVREA